MVLIFIENSVAEYLYVYQWCIINYQCLFSTQWDECDMNRPKFEWNNFYTFLSLIPICTLPVCQKGWYWYLDQGIKLIYLVPNTRIEEQYLINKKGKILER